MRKRELPRVASLRASDFTSPPLEFFSLRGEGRRGGAGRAAISRRARVILLDDFCSAREFLLRFSSRCANTRRAVASRGNSCATNYYTLAYHPHMRSVDDTRQLLCPLAHPPLPPPPLALSLSRTSPSVFVLIIIHHATISNGCATSFISRLLVRAIVKSLDRLLATRTLFSADARMYIGERK